MLANSQAISYFRIYQDTWLTLSHAIIAPKNLYQENTYKCFFCYFCHRPLSGVGNKEFCCFSLGWVPSIHGSLTELTNDCFNYQTVAIYGWWGSEAGWTPLSIPSPATTLNLSNSYKTETLFIIYLTAGQVSQSSYFLDILHQNIDAAKLTVWNKSGYN